MKNIKLNYSKLSDESLDDWLEREGLEIIIEGHEPDSFLVSLKFKEPIFRITYPGMLSYHFGSWGVSESAVEDITENGLKKIFRNKNFVKVRYYKEQVKIKKFFRTKTVEKVKTEETLITVPNFKVE